MSFNHLGELDQSFGACARWLAPMASSAREASPERTGWGSLICLASSETTRSTPPNPTRAYHRLAGPTQDARVAALQLASSEIWGRRNGNTYQAARPSVDAFAGPLADGARGIEFETDVPPDRGLPPYRARWTGPRPGVVIDGEWARMRVKIIRSTEREGPS